MRITKTIDVTCDVEIDLSADDLGLIISESPDRLATVLRGINDIARFMQAVPDEIITEMTGQQRSTIASFLEKQVDRLKAPDVEPAHQALKGTIQGETHG